MRTPIAAVSLGGTTTVGTFTDAIFGRTGPPDLRPRRVSSLFVAAFSTLEAIESAADFYKIFVLFNKGILSHRVHVYGGGGGVK